MITNYHGTPRVSAAKIHAAESASKTCSYDGHNLCHSKQAAPSALLFSPKVQLTVGDSQGLSNSNERILGIQGVGPYRKASVTVAQLIFTVNSSNEQDFGKWYEAEAAAWRRAAFRMFKKVSRTRVHAIVYVSKNSELPPDGYVVPSRSPERRPGRIASSRSLSDQELKLKLCTQSSFTKQNLIKGQDEHPHALIASDCCARTKENMRLGKKCKQRVESKVETNHCYE